MFAPARHGRAPRTFGDKAAMTEPNKDKMHFVGLDPGGDGQFGWCVVAGSELPLSVIQAGCTGDAGAAVKSVLEVLGPSPQAHGAGIDSPLFWTPSGKRRVDCIVREAIKEVGAPNAGGTVQHVNSLRGACLAQGVVAANLSARRFMAYESPKRTRKRCSGWSTSLRPTAGSSTSR